MRDDTRRRGFQEVRDADGKLICRYDAARDIVEVKQRYDKARRASLTPCRERAARETGQG